MEDNKTLYTITIFSENTVGVLNQITTIFTRRQLNIETLSVSPSAIKGIHKFTITTFANDEEIMKKLVRLIDKRVDILKAYYNTDEDLVHQEVALYKMSTDKVLEHGSIEYLVRKYNLSLLFNCRRCSSLSLNIFVHNNYTLIVMNIKLSLPLPCRPNLQSVNKPLMHLKHFSYVKE
jgi:acetolactate synthase small subunit